MFRSLHMKLTLIMLLLITSLMAVVGAFLTTSVSSFFINTFYEQMDSVFGSEQQDFVTDLRSAAAQEDGAGLIKNMLDVKAGELGIDGLVLYLGEEKFGLPYLVAFRKDGGVSELVPVQAYITGCARAGSPQGSSIETGSH